MRFIISTYSKEGINKLAFWSVLDESYQPSYERSYERVFRKIYTYLVIFSKESVYVNARLFSTDN